MNVLTKRIYNVLLKMNPDMKLDQMTEVEANKKFGCSTRTLQQIWKCGQAGEKQIDLDIQKGLNQGLKKKYICLKIINKYGITTKVVDRIWKKRQSLYQKLIDKSTLKKKDSTCDITSSCGTSGDSSDESSCESNMEACSSTISSSSSDTSENDSDVGSIVGSNTMKSKEKSDKIPKVRFLDDSIPTTLFLRSISEQESNYIYSSLCVLIKNTGGYSNQIDGVDLKSQYNDRRPSLQQMSYETGVPLLALQTVLNL